MRILSRIIKKLTKKTILAILAIVVISVPLLYLTLLNSKPAQAAWFDDSWLYRAAIPITAHTAAESNVFITVTIDTATPITAGKMQSDCGDLRFTKENGELLPYFINASPGCNNAATTIQVNFDSFPAGAQTIYYYYGNPSAPNGFNNAGFATAASGATIGTVGSETQGTGPVAYWKFDDGTGTTAQDSSSNNLDGTLNNTPTWTTGDLCIFVKCLYFDGTNNENVSKSDDAKLDFAAADNFTLSAWVRKSGAASANTVILGKASANIGSTYQGYKLYMDSSGDFCFDTQDGTLAVDTACTSAVEFDDDKWHLVQGMKTGTTKIELFVDGKLRASDSSIASTGSLANSGTFYAGIDSDGLAIEWKGFIDEVKVYGYARSASQIQADFSSRGSIKGVSARMGGTDLDYLSQGLVGYWKMDEASGNAVDSSGNGTTLTNNNTTAFAGGKFGNAGSFTAASSHYFSTASTISGVKTVAFWVNPTANTDEYINLTASAYITSTSGTLSAAGFNSPSIYVNGALNGTVSANAWNHVVVTTDTAINANVFEAGRANSSYINGKMDETRVYNRALSPKEVSDLYNFAPGPVGYWRMDDKVSGNSQTLADASGYGNNGTTYWGANAAGMNCKSAGKFGGACLFDGVDDYAQITDTAGLDNWKAQTISFWINTTNGMVQHARIMEKGTNQEWAIVFNDSASTGKISVQSPGCCAPPVTSTNNLADGKWHYISVVIDVNGTIYLYVDGSFDVSNTSTISSGTNPIYIGQFGGGGYFYKGYLDDVKIYNYARTQKQIVSDMNAGHPAVGSPLGSSVAYWKLDEGYGTTANDSSPNANALTLSSASWTDSGKFGKAWNGTGALWLSRADDSDFDVSDTDDYTVSLWYKSDSASNPGAVEYLFNKANATTAGYAVYANTSGNLCFGIDDDTSWGPDIASCTSTDVYDNTWHHLVAVRDHNNTDQTLIYIDGVLKDSDSDSTTATLANTLTLYAGDRDGTDNGDEFNGDLDEIKVYRYALTADEVKLDMNQGSSEVLGALGSNSTYASNASNQEYCVPGDATSCAAPVGRWDFEEGIGSTVNDSSGNGNTGTWSGSGSHWTAGKIGKAGNFKDSNNDYTYTNSSVTGTTSITFEGWIKPTDNTDGKPLAKWDDGVSLGYTYLLYLTANNGTANCYYHNGSFQYSVISAVNININTWNYIVCVKDGTSSFKIYVNGILSNTNSSIAGNLNTNSVPFKIGAGGGTGTSDNPFTGQVDQVRVYNYARSAAQVAWDYNRGAPVGHWKLDDCQGSTVQDSTANNNDGTITIGGSGEDTLGTCTTSSTAWGSGATGKRNYSLSLDGTDDFITTVAFSPLAAAGQTTKIISWGGWFYPATSAASKTLLEKATEFQLTTDSNSMPICGVYYSAAFHNSAAPTTALTLNTWNHVLCTYDGTNINTYLNGKLIKQSSETNNVTAASSILYMGETSGGANRYSGQVDDVRIFNYALSATQVKDIMNDGAVRFGPLTGSP